MRFSRIHRILLALSLLSWPALAQPTTENASLLLRSDPGDFIGQGQNYFYPPGSAPVYGYAFGYVIDITFGTSPHWRLCFAAPDGLPLRPGFYQNAVRYPYNGPGVPGLSVTGGSGPGGGCNTVTGSFTVLQVAYQHSDFPSGYDGIASFWAVFEQHCEGAGPALRGEVRYNIAPEPAAVVPAFGLPGRVTFLAALAVVGVLLLRGRSA